MKKLFILMVLLSAPVIAQCDWNADGVINVIDVVQTVDCILNDCFSEDIYGCTDPTALNYNPEANIDDGGCEYEGFVIDIDGNVYSTIMVGDQEWMAENLKVTRYRNGDPLIDVPDEEQWNWMYNGAYCSNENDDNNESSFGYLYNWYAVDDDRGVCPENWHVPTLEEWQNLVEDFGGNDVAGAHLKATGTLEGGDGLWHEPNPSTNESGFTALPGGYRNGSYFESVGSRVYFWSSTRYQVVGQYSHYIKLNNYDTSATISYFEWHKGLSIRCVSD